MASYQQHITFSIIVGIGCGLLGYFFLHFTPVVCLLALILGAAGGFVPDLDSDHSIPVRETFAFVAALAPLLFIQRLAERTLSLEWLTVLLATLYLLIRFGVSYAFKRLTAHRGMWHSIPATLIWGELIFLIYHELGLRPRLFVAVSGVAGMLSHLVLDEIYAVDFMGLKLKRNQFSGSALSFYSNSFKATSLTYLLLLGLTYLIYLEFS